MDMRMVGNADQLVKARRIAFRDGMSSGVQAIELQNQDGLYMTCIEDLCLNIFDFSYKGINFAFQSKNGLVSNRFFNGGCAEFGHYWPAGMLYTCGLTNNGPASMDGGVYHPEHGRIGMMPARDVAIQRTENAVIITGTVDESVICGHHLQMHRTIRFPHAGKEVEICDEIANLEPQPMEMALLYHFNFGYPLLQPGARIIKGAGNIYNLLGTDPVPDDWWKVGEPKDHKLEELFCHENTADADGWGCAAVINDNLSLGGYVKYKLEFLPLLVHWKNMCSHDYCVGLEPSNNYIKGRAAERENGTLPQLAPYERRTFNVKLGVLDGQTEIQNFTASLK